MWDNFGPFLSLLNNISPCQTTLNHFNFFRKLWTIWTIFDNFEIFYNVLNYLDPFWTRPTDWTYQTRDTEKDKIGRVASVEQTLTGKETKMKIHRLTLCSYRDGAFPSVLHIELLLKWLSYYIGLIVARLLQYCQMATISCDKG